MEEQVARIIMKCSAYAIILPMLFSIVRLRNGNREQRLLSQLIFVSFFFEFAALIIGTGWHLNNLFLLHIFTIIEFCFLVTILKPFVQELISKKHLNYLILGFTVFSLYNSLFIENIFQFNAFARAIEAILIMALTLSCLYIILKNLKFNDFRSAPFVWIAMGSLIYFSGSFFVFVFSNYILPFETISFTTWGIHAFMSILLNLFYTIALWFRPKM